MFSPNLVNGCTGNVWHTTSTTQGTKPWGWGWQASSTLLAGNAQVVGEVWQGSSSNCPTNRSKPGQGGSSSVPRRLAGNANAGVNCLGQVCLQHAPAGESSSSIRGMGQLGACCSCLRHRQQGPTCLFPPVPTPAHAQRWGKEHVQNWECLPLPLWYATSSRR